MRVTLLIAACAAITAAIKGIGPLAFGGRPLPRPLAAGVERVAPPLLAGLVVSQALADGDRLAVGADTAGVLAAGLAAWRGASVIVCVLLAAGVTACARALL